MLVPVDDEGEIARGHDNETEDYDAAGAHFLDFLPFGE